ncbi:MAG: anaerobic ribonucleoside-triphosphate reductase [Alphaproteobacteria bacterium]|nr:anaerobic ribonucleoside-triphosphate reductase [Alphaproteobacteria bacterium]
MAVIKIEDITLNDAERQPCEIWTRVMGYHRPVSEFNRGKKSEYYSRKCFCEEKAVSHIITEEACACAAE